MTSRSRPCRPARQGRAASTERAASASEQPRRSDELTARSSEPLLISSAAILATLLLFGVFDLRWSEPAGRAGDVPRRVRYFLLSKHAAALGALMPTALCTALPMQLGLLGIGGEGALVVGSRRSSGGRLCTIQPYTVLTAMFLRAQPLADCGLYWSASCGRTAASASHQLALLMSYIAIALMNHLVEGALRDPESGTSLLSSRRRSEHARPHSGQDVH